MGSGRQRLYRNLLGTVIIAAAIAIIGLGLPAINREIPSVRSVVAGRPYLVGAGVTVLPPPGSSLDATQTRPGTTTGQVLFYLGTVRYTLVATPFTGTLGQAVTHLRSTITAKPGYQVTGPESPIKTRTGVAGAQGMYSSSGRDGRYAVFVSNGVSVQVTLAGTDVDLRPLLPEIESSIASITFPAA
jgi:hypothetical protein